MDWGGESDSPSGRGGDGEQGSPLRESADQFGDDAAFLDTSEAGIEALDTDGEAVVLDAEEVKDGGVEVADVDRVLDDVV